MGGGKNVPVLTAGFFQPFRRESETKKSFVTVYRGYAEILILFL